MDGLTGFKGSLIRGTVVQRSRRSLADYLASTKQKIEAAYRANTVIAREMVTFTQVLISVVRRFLRTSIFPRHVCFSPALPEELETFVQECTTDPNGQYGQWISRRAGELG